MTRDGELETVRRQGKRFRTANLEVRHIASLLRYPRVGLVVPRYSHTAVERNRIKRRLREIVRIDVLPGLSAVEFVVRALPSAYRASFSELREQCMQTRDRLAGTVDH